MLDDQGYGTVMTISSKVVAFALFGLSALTIDYIVAHQYTAGDQICAVANNSLIFSSVSEPQPDSLHPTALQLRTAKAKSQRLASLTDCLSPEEKSVSWVDWVFSWQDSPTFHYLDLLELLSNNNDDSSHGSGQPSPVKN